MAQVRRFDGHSDRITDLQVSEDCAWLLSSAMDGTLRVWDIPAAATFQVHHAWRSAVVLEPAAVPMAAVATRVAARDHPMISSSATLQVTTDPAEATPSTNASK